MKITKQGHFCSRWRHGVQVRLIRSVPNGFWKVKENQREFLQFVAQKFNIKQPYDWKNVSIQNVLDERGTSLLNKYYNGSLYKALKSNFPGIFIAFVIVQKSNGKKIGFHLFPKKLLVIGKAKKINGHSLSNLLRKTNC